MDSEPKIFRPSGTHVQLTGISLVALVAVGWAFITQDTPLQPDGRPVPPRMLIQWSYFLASLVLLVSSLYAGCFTFINEQKHRCHPKCHLLFIGLTLPGFSSIFNVSDSQSDDVLMLALSVQLVFVALMYCVIASEYTQYHPTSNKRLTIGTLVGRFMQLDLGLQIFLLFSLFLSSFSLFPYAWRAFMPSGFWEARIVGLDGVISLGNAMAALLGYQLLDYLPPKAGIAHIVCYGLCALGSILPAAPFRFLILTLPILVQVSGIFWDILEVNGKQAYELQQQSDDCKYWQSMAEQLQVINNLRESAITTKSSFLAGLANEMKSIVHGTSMIMSMLNDTDIQPNQGTYLARLDRAVDRLTNLVREAQYYFEVESQKSTTDSVPFRLDQLLEEVINSTPIRSHLEERDVDVTYLVESKVPMCLLGDYFRLKNILLRLLTNAIKATVQGEIIIWVRLNSPTPNVPTSPSSISSTTHTTPPTSPQPVRQALRVSSDPATKVSDLKISKLVPHEALTTAYSTSHSAPTTPMSSHRDMSPRSASALATSQSFSSASPRNRRNPYNINVNTNLDSNSYENLSSPKAQHTPRNPNNNNHYTNNNNISNNNSHNSSHNLQRSSSLNSLRTPTPKSATGYRVPPDFENDSHTTPPSPSPLSPPTPPPTILHDGKDLLSSLGDDVVQLSISVVDTGIGIPPEDLSRIFEPFAMVNRKREDTDLGLGLSICKQLSRLFGGNLTVQSELSRGTSFTLTCPFKINSNTQLQNINNMFGTGSMLQREWGIGKTICVIDNNISIGEVCKMHLAPVGCEILYYPTSGEALSQMKVLAELGRKLDVVLVGYRLYGTNGEETAKLLRSDPDLQSIPIVFMCTAKQRKQVTLSNAHYLYKPLKKEQLLTVVHMLCTAQAHSSAPPSPDTVRDFNNSPDVRSPNSPLTSSSPSVYRNPLASSHRLFPHSSLVTPLTLPTLPPLVEQDEKAKENHFAEDIERVKQLQQEQNQLSQQFQKQQETDKMDSVQLQQPLPPPIKVTDIPQPSSIHVPSTPRDTTPIPTPRTPAANSTTPRNIASPRTALPDSPQARRNSLGHDQPLPAPAAPDAHALPPAETATPPPPPKKETILLVEDNPINAKIASAVLRRHQFEVELAGNGQVALEKVKLGHGNFQLILMDIHMPVMDGLTCARLTRQYEKEHNLVQIPIIALTADATSLHRTACLEAGCNEFMSKPLDYPLLIEILKKLSAGGTLAAAQP